MSLDLETLGFTKEELQERVVERICEQVLSGVGYDPDSDAEFTTASQFHRELDKRIKEQINTTINAIAEREVLPNVSAYIESLTLQETNSWGEKRGESVSFTEYLVQRAQAYMREEVNYQGKSKAEADGYSWSGSKQTRVTHLIHEHLQHSIATAMKDALTVATGEIARGIHETARHKLNEIAANLKVQVATK